MYDYLIVGAGMFGSVFAREMTDAGAKCLVVDKRNHIGGNCYTEDREGIHVHKYGAHIFHTNNKEVWDYVNKWASFNAYRHHLKVTSGKDVFSFPINMMTLHQLWSVKSPEEAIKKLDEVRIPIENPSNLEEWILSQVGEEIYKKFIQGYTKKQWGREPKTLPSSIIKRIPIRLTYNDGYFDDTYQGIPVGGYTQIFDKMLNGIPIELGVDFVKEKDRLDILSKKIVYTGAIDELFDYQLGVLDWRSLEFEEEEMSGDYQGVSVMNYAEEKIPYTRIIEHKHFDFKKFGHTVITREYPKKWERGDNKIYPVNNDKNNNLHLQYKKMVDDRYILGGRLANYRYYDMHQVLAAALTASRREIDGRRI